MIFFFYYIIIYHRCENPWYTALILNIEVICHIERFLDNLLVYWFNLLV